MQLHLLLLFPLAVASLHHPRDEPHIIDLSTASVPTVREAAKNARQLVRSETIGTLSSIFPSAAGADLAGEPIGLMDYFADCSGTGDPSLIAMNIATSFRNVLPTNASISLSVRKHTPSHMFSPAAHPRVALIGKLVIEDADAEKKRIEGCFTKRHPDAKWWVPGGKVHGGFWVRLEVERIYWVGGFGGVAYIGWIPKELYHAVELEEGEEEPVEAWEEQQEQQQELR
jgi:hypothetical protein